MLVRVLTICLLATAVAAQRAVPAKAARVVRFDRLIVPVRVPVAEQPKATIGRAMRAWIGELEHPMSRRRALARAWLERVDWRYANIFERHARSRKAEVRRALRAIVVKLRDRRYNGEAAVSKVDEAKFPPRS